MLRTECARVRASIRLDQHIGDIQSMNTGLIVEGNFLKITTWWVVMATGRISFPKISASGFGYKIAQKLVSQWCHHAVSWSHSRFMQKW